MSNPIEFTSRYDVLGPPNGCKGDCEGTGFVPIKHGPAEDGLTFADEEPTPLYRVLWYFAEAKSPNEPGDRWHFVPCPACRADDPAVKLAHLFLRGE